MLTPGCFLGLRSLLLIVWQSVAYCLEVWDIAVIFVVGKDEGCFFAEAISGNMPLLSYILFYERNKILSVLGFMPFRRSVCARAGTDVGGDGGLFCAAD